MSDAQDPIEAMLGRLGVHVPTLEEEAAVAAAAQRHREAKAAAFAAWLAELFREVDAKVSDVRHQRVAYVERSLYGSEVPESRDMLDNVSRLAGSQAEFFDRAMALHALATRWADEPEDEPSPAIYWDTVRNQKAGTHKAAVELLLDTIVVAFNCDQYASAKHIWRDRVATS